MHFYTYSLLIIRGGTNMGKYRNDNAKGNGTFVNGNTEIRHGYVEAENNEIIEFYRKLLRGSLEIDTGAIFLGGIAKQEGNKSRVEFTYLSSGSKYVKDVFTRGIPGCCVKLDGERLGEIPVNAMPPGYGFSGKDNMVGRG